MLPVTNRENTPRIIHQHTHVHHHVHRIRHVHNKPARFYSGESVEAGRARGRSGARATHAAPRIPSRSPSPSKPLSRAQRARRIFRRYVVPVLGWLFDALVFCLTRISFGFGFRVGHLPFFGDNVD